MKQDSEPVYKWVKASDEVWDKLLLKARTFKGRKYISIEDAIEFKNNGWLKEINQPVEDKEPSLVDSWKDKEMAMLAEKATKFEAKFNRSEDKLQKAIDEAKNIHYKWSKIIAVKLYGRDKATFTHIEAQEILDDIKSLSSEEMKQYLKQLNNQ